MFKFVTRVRDTVRRWQRVRRERKVLKACGCVCWCPNCKEPLNDQARWTTLSTDGLGRYWCRECNAMSLWHFGAAPVPLLMDYSVGIHD